MTIPWAYLNKYAATIDALKDYNSMKHILLSYSDDTTEAREHLISVRTPTLTWSAPGSQNPHAEEGKIAFTLDLIDVVTERYQRALEYMAWFQPAWDAIMEEERQILSEFYLREGEYDGKADVIQRLCDKLRIERSAVYRRKDKAVARLALLLYGK